MAKILLAEDDANLREIFEMRLKAEGFEVLTAGDGEEALVIATKELPDLIVVDIMMPKISGFEMLETLRTNPATANIKAIMMTALGQAEDRERGAKLGVLKYLVKSQVTLEDFVRTIKEILGVSQSNNQTRSNMDDPTQNPMPNNTPADPAVPASDSPAAAPAPDATPPAAPVALPSDEQSASDEAADVKAQEDSFAPAPAPDATPPAEPATDSSMPAPSDSESGAPAPAADPAQPENPASAPGETISPDTNSQA